MAELHLAPAQKQTVVDSMVSELIAQIQSGNLQPGSQLPSQRDLSEAFGSGRSSVREALQALAGMNMVRTYPGKGTFVTEAAQNLPRRQPADVVSSALERTMRGHLVEARVVVEGAIVQLAAEKLVPESVPAIQTALDEYVQHTRDPGRCTEWETHDRLHVSLAEATGNPLLPRVVEYLLDLIPRGVRDRQILEADHAETERHFEIERRLHRELCEAVMARDPSLAQESLARQMEYEARAVRDYFAHEDATE